MPPTDIQRQILLRVVRTFLEKFGQSTSRRDLLIEFQSVSDLDDLLHRHLLKSYDPGGEDYLPTALAFHYARDPSLDAQARRTVQLLGHVLRKQFLNGEVKLSREGLEEDACKIDYSTDLKTIELGIYLGAELNLFQSFAGGNQHHPLITPIKISERIVDLKNPDEMWDDYVAKWNPWPLQDSFGEVTGTYPTIKNNPEPPQSSVSSERRWTRVDKLSLLGVLVATAAGVISFTVPEVRLFLHLDRPQPAAAVDSRTAAAETTGGAVSSSSKASEKYTPEVSTPSEPAAKDWVVGDWLHTAKTPVSQPYTSSGTPSNCVYTEENTDEIVVSEAATVTPVTATLSVSQKRHPTSGDCTNIQANFNCQRIYEARIAPTQNANVWSLNAVSKEDSCEEQLSAISGSLTRLSAVEMQFEAPTLNLQEVLSRKKW